MINSRNIDDLLPPVRERAERFIAACAKQGIDVLITSTYRDNESQAALFAQGRTAPGRVVTNAAAGQSFHNWRCAFDFVPIVGGKAMWADTGLIGRCGLIAEQSGLDWAGRWKFFKEQLHCQYTGNLTLADLQAGKTNMRA
jgi:peptidoglycan L-alanyl-D-glutamate endopeptidase CwlK